MMKKRVKATIKPKRQPGRITGKQQVALYFARKDRRTVARKASS